MAATRNSREAAQVIQGRRTGRAEVGAGMGHLGDGRGQKDEVSVAQGRPGARAAKKSSAVSFAWPFCCRGWFGVSAATRSDRIRSERLGQELAQQLGGLLTE